MDLDDGEYGFHAGFPPSQVSLTPFISTVSPSPRRLSSCFTHPAEAIRSKRRLAWVSLQGRLVGADDASSAAAVDPNGAFTTEQAAAWELFSPVQRVLTVAVVGAAAASSKKNEQIVKLQKSVELRDQVLLCMQKKLDNLCEQLKYVKDQPEETGCKLCNHDPPQNGSLFNTSTKGSNGDDVFPISNMTEPDERRMSDLSDWAQSVTSSVDIQLESLALDQDFDSLKRECDQKDVTIKELATYLQSSEASSSKRIMELEGMVRRKNMIITKLRKDMAILEEKVVNIARRGRHSSSGANSHVQRLPTLTDNLVYDMDSMTDPSSSDSDSIPRNRTQAPLVEVQRSEKGLKGNMKCDHDKSSPPPSIQQNVNVNVKALKKSASNQTPDSVGASKPKHVIHGSGENRSRRRQMMKSKEVVGAAQKRWV